MTNEFETMLGRLLLYFYQSSSFGDIQYWELTSREKAIIKSQENLDELIAWARKVLDNDKVKN